MTLARGELIHEQDGLSPRVRGNQCCSLKHYIRTLLRVYPRVCGGTWGLRKYTWWRSDACVGERLLGMVYPRVCGGTPYCLSKQGLSPRVRGNPTRRMCRWYNQRKRGLSPRVRGNPLDSPLAIPCGLPGEAASYL